MLLVSLPSPDAFFPLQMAIASRNVKPEAMTRRDDRLVSAFQLDDYTATLKLMKSVFLSLQK